jgi:hypothetical protein
MRTAIAKKMNPEIPVKPKMPATQPDKIAVSVLDAPNTLALCAACGADKRSVNRGTDMLTVKQLHENETD